MRGVAGAGRQSVSFTDLGADAGGDDGATVDAGSAPSSSVSRSKIPAVDEARWARPACARGCGTTSASSLSLLALDVSSAVVLWLSRDDPVGRRPRSAAGSGWLDDAELSTSSMPDSSSVLHGAGCEDVRECPRGRPVFAWPSALSCGEGGGSGGGGVMVVRRLLLAYASPALGSRTHEGAARVWPGADRCGRSGARATSGHAKGLCLRGWVRARLPYPCCGE